jgi:hypothetical protein
MRNPDFVGMAILFWVDWFNIFLSFFFKLYSIIFNSPHSIISKV